MIKRLIAILVLVLTAAACIVVDGAIALSSGQLEKRLRLEAGRLLAAPFDFESVRFSFTEGLTVEKFQVGSPGQPALAVKSINVQIQLLRQKVTKVVIEEPNAFFHLCIDGSTNFDNLLRPQPQEAPSETRLPLIEVARGKITARIEPASDDVIEAVLHDISGSIKQGSASSPVDLSLLLHSRELGKITIEGSAAPDFKSGLFTLGTKNVSFTSAEPLFPRDVGNILAELNAAGKANLTARLEIRDGKPIFEAEAECFNCSVKYSEFPVPVEDISGTVKVSPLGVKLTGFSGQAFSNPVCLEGEVTFKTPRPDIKIDLTARNLKASDELLAAIPESERKIISEFSPHGKADISINIKNTADSAILEPTVRVEAKDGVSIAYFEFPYRLENLTGTLLITPGKIEINNITSTMGNQVVTGNGHVIPSDTGVEADVRIKGKGIRIDKRLREALGESERETWDLLQPSGTANMTVSIASPAGLEKVDVGVEVQLDGFADITPEPFPLRIKRLKGSLSILPEGALRLSSIRGYASGGEVAVADTEISMDEKSPIVIDASFSNVNAGRDVIKALGQAIEEDLDDLSAGGSVSGRIHLNRPEGLEDFSLTGTVLLKDGWLLHKLFPVKAEKLEGTLLVKPGGYFLRNLAGEAAGGRLEAWGEILEMPGGRQKIRLRVEGFNILADGNLRDSLPEELLSTWNDFNLYGRADAAIWLDGITPFENVKKSVKLHLRDVSGKYVEFPYPVSGVTGEVRIDVDTGKIDIKEIATPGRGIVMSGTVAPQGKRIVTKLHIKANKIKLEDTLRDAMPEEVKSLWKDLEFAGVTSGTINLHLDQLENADPAMDYDILLKPVDAEVEAGFPMRKLKGKVTLKGNITPEGKHTLNRGLIQLSNFTVNGLPVSWVSAPIKLTDDTITLEPITGRMGGGTLSGKLNVLFEKETLYSGNFELKEASVRQSAEELFGGDMEKTTGRATAWIRFQGRGDDDSSLRGKGEIELTRSNLWQVPFFSALIKSISGGVIPGVDFTKSFAHFRIKGEKLHFTKVYFNSSMMKLIGTGTMDLEGNIDFIIRVSLLGNTPFFKFIPGIKEIIQSVEGQILAVRATGTAKKVSITIAPKQVLEMLKDLEKTEEDTDKNK